MSDETDSLVASGSLQQSQMTATEPPIEVQYIHPSASSWQPGKAPQLSYTFFTSLTDDGRTVTRLHGRCNNFTYKDMGDIMLVASEVGYKTGQDCGAVPKADLRKLENELTAEFTESMPSAKFSYMKPSVFVKEVKSLHERTNLSKYGRTVFLWDEGPASLANPHYEVGEDVSLQSGPGEGPTCILNSDTLYDVAPSTCSPAQPVTYIGASEYTTDPGKASTLFYSYIEEEIPDKPSKWHLRGKAYNVPYDLLCQAEQTARELEIDEGESYQPRVGGQQPPRKSLHLLATTLEEQEAWSDVDVKYCRPSIYGKALGPLEDKEKGGSGAHRVALFDEGYEILKDGECQFGDGVTLESGYEGLYRLLTSLGNGRLAVLRSDDDVAD